MSKLTLDTAIKHCLEVAENNEQFASGKWIGSEGEANRQECLQCAADHRQLAEWLTEYKELKKINEKIYDVLAKQFGSPCNCNYAVDEYMRKNGGCDDCGVEIPDKECWSRYIQTKLIGDENDAK